MRRKIVFLIPSLAGGGAERVFLNLCNSLDKEKYDLTLCLLKKEGDYLEFIDSNDFEILDLGISRVRFSIIPIFRYIYRFKPDILISTLGHLNALLGALKPFFPRKTKLIARESNIVSQKNYSREIELLYKMFYKNFEKIIVQSDDMAKDLNEFVNNLKFSQVIKINNPINLKGITEKLNTNAALFPDGKINLLSVGSLTWQKGFDLLLESFSKFENIENYHLTILGRGTMKDTLEGLAVDLGIAPHVTFGGFQSNPYQFMEKASIFVSSSRFEGFPNVVLESLACNTPVIANQYLGGIHEIINESIYGKVIDIKRSDLFQKSCHEILARKIKENFLRDKIMKRYGIKKITAEYERLLDSL